MDDHELNFASSLRHNSSSKTLESDSSERMNRRQSKVSIFHLAAFVFVLGFCFLVAGVVLITLSQTRTSETQKNSAFNQTIDSKENYTFGENKTVTESRCAFSSGGQLAGLESFFRKIREVQTSFTPYKSYLTKEQFKPYNPEPQAVKKLTDQTKRLYEELLEIKARLEVGKLKLHERRQLAVAEHELKHFFGKPYGNNYYTDEVHDLGWRQLTRYHQQAVNIAKKITGQRNESEAVSEFKRQLNSFAFCINKQPFPVNESDEKAFQRCKNDKDATIYCPQRYTAMSHWMETVRSTMTFLRGKLLKLFYFNGDRRTIPTCPDEPVISFSRYFGVATHTPSVGDCRRTARYNLPFFVDRMGCKYMEWTTAVHEAVPGHHLQSEGYKAIFQPRIAPCPSILKPSPIMAYKEGWATYAEHPLMSLDSDLYAEQPLRYYGVIRSQIWRALRLVIDTGLHYKNMSRNEALTIFRQYMWDNSDIVRKEISRYQAWPGQATSYMIGQLEIWRMRNESEASLGSNYDIRDFHYHVLSQGNMPLWFLDEHIKNFYVRCVLSEASEDDSERCFGDFDKRGFSRSL